MRKLNPIVEKILFITFITLGIFIGSMIDFKATIINFMILTFLCGVEILLYKTIVNYGTLLNEKSI